MPDHQSDCDQTASEYNVRIAHLSDLHFGRDQTEVAEKIVKQLNRMNLDQIIISGDLTQIASHEEFIAARQFIDQLEAPVHVVPGNHDLSPNNLPERFLYPWQKWKRHIQPELQPITDTSKTKIVGLNTARRMGWYLDWSRGRINDQQIRHVIEQLSDTDHSKLRIVVAHHPFWLPPSSMHRKLIGGRDEAIEQFDTLDVDLVLGGHIHIAFAETLQGIVVSHAGTTTSDRLLKGHPNSFNLIEGNRQQLSITEWNWHNDAFRSGHCRSFSRIGDNWENDERANLASAQ